jgi:hypothetical protein
MTEVSRDEYQAFRDDLRDDLKSFKTDIRRELIYMFAAAVPSTGVISGLISTHLRHSATHTAVAVVSHLIF